MNIKCPACGHVSDVDGEDLPECVCDDSEYECPSCEHHMKVGWYATAEVRDTMLDDGVG